MLCEPNYQGTPLQALKAKFFIIMRISDGVSKDWDYESADRFSWAGTFDFTDTVRKVGTGHFKLMFVNDFISRAKPGGSVSLL